VLACEPHLRYFLLRLDVLRVLAVKIYLLLTGFWLNLNLAIDAHGVDDVALKIHEMLHDDVC